MTHPARNSRRAGDWLWSLEQLLGDGRSSNLTSSRKPSGIAQPGAPFPSPVELFLGHLRLSFVVPCLRRCFLPLLVWELLTGMILISFFLHWLSVYKYC